MFTQQKSQQQQIHENNTTKVPRKTTHSWPVIHNSDRQGTRNTWLKSPQYEFDAGLFLSQQPETTPNYSLDQQTTSKPTTTYQQFFLGADGIDYYYGDPNAIDDNHNTISNGSSMNDSNPRETTQNSIYQTQLSSPNICTTSPNPVVILFLTLLMTTGATAMLCAGIMTSQWEFVRWDMKILKKLTNESAHTKNIEWMLNGKVARIPIKGEF